jgi:hypothetical protein
MRVRVLGALTMAQLVETSKTIWFVTIAYQKSNRLVPLFAREVYCLLSIQAIHHCNGTFKEKPSRRVNATSRLTRSISLVDTTVR